MPCIIIILAALWIWPVSLIATMAANQPPPRSEAGLKTYYPLPGRIALCGSEVPLQEPDVREDLDREFTIILWSRTQTTLWIKRAARYFPYLEKRLQEARLPEDLKYVVIVESDLRLEARSPSGAIGPWQFMKPAANRFLLKTEVKIDDRYDFMRSTEAALQYLAILYRDFKNWPLALAAYNCGEGRLRKAIQEQGVADYYRLDLPDETDRYVMRLIAAKIILSDPAGYGYDVPAEDLYPPLQPDQVEFVLDQEIHLRQVAEACGSYYKKLRRLNPRLQSATLPPGMYRLNVPAGTAPRFYDAYIHGRLVAEKKGP
ncbi:lytic transglycosylase domain-containing protein [Desulfobacca acetoxidans]|uniref:Lytic transglycosylase catalytic n=1 Tax=Desulfobacca acetoxidans (strain ATCC 700848 / DSM 11109 / ASRB2) TaxID=880072 RepID=F2NER6_DESAR|nr:lytic transglycosylase domain-containing protein [Desulfobacca acetoxidans]AEB08256.1 Lytic transglycosylase catalytic [Desulfobacca acetoxidans DSM 11109]